ncbi:MAG: hypothetical protein RR245_00910 [Clostridia bacterium]
MNYKNNYLNKEFKESFIDQKVSNRNIFWCGIFLGMITFALYFLFQSMTGSILNDVLPSIMTPSYFATLYLYINLAEVFVVVYILIYYDALTFSEISKSKWYAPIKIGKSPIKMILAKVFARFLNILFIYTLGYLVTLLMTSLLNYTFVIHYIFPLYLSGLAQITFILLGILTMSLISSDKSNTRRFVVLGVVILFIIKCASGYYSFESNRILMQDIDKMASNAYFILILVGIVALGIVSIVYAKKHCFYSHKASALSGKIAVFDDKTKKIKGVVKHKKYETKWIEVLGNSIAIAILTLALGLNIFILFMTSGSTSGVNSIGGKMPYIFSSSTMSPIIEKNDLAFFKKVDATYLLKVGDIIMFTDENVTYVEKIVEINDKIVVDIVAYPQNVPENAMKKYIERQQVDAIHVGNNRVLGAVIMFANSYIGRVIMLLLPIIFLFFNKKIIARFFKYKPNKNNIEEEYFYFDEKAVIIVDGTRYYENLTDASYGDDKPDDFINGDTK